MAEGQEYSYLQSTKSISDVAMALRNRMPVGGIVTSDYIRAACAVSDGTAKNIINDLKKFKFIGEDGSLTDLGRLLRNPERYGEMGQQVLHEMFPDIITMLELQPEKWAALLDNILSERTNLGDSARGKVRLTIKFFWEMAHGKVSGVEEKKSAPPKSSAKPSSRATARAKPGSSAGERPATASQSPLVDLTAGQPRLDILSSVLRVNIDGTWDQDRINLLFDRLERLLGLRGEEGMIDDSDSEAS